jgi:glycosyltransferase involved in cell wall biosynthesis
MSDSKSVDVTVIIPAFNRAKYLPESIDSILRQKWKGSLEIICVDDGSTSDPFELLPRDLPPQIRLLRKDHEGVGAARQFALEHSNGKYIAFNDDDDLWLEDSLSMRTAVLEQYPDLDLVFTDLREFSDSGDAPRTRYSGRRELAIAQRIRLRDIPTPVYRYDRDSLVSVIMSGANLFFQTILVRRSFLDRIGGMDKRTRSCGDCLDFALRATHNGVVGYLDASTFRLRRGHVHMTATDDWLEREMREFSEVFPDYPQALRDQLKPWLGRFLANKGWIHFLRGDYREAAAAYKEAAQFGSIGVRARAKWIISTILSVF